MLKESKKYSKGVEVPMVRVNCAFCGAEGCERVITTCDYEGDVVGEYDIVKCKECGYVYTSTRPEAEKLFKICYPDDYICFDAGKGSTVGRMLDKLRTHGQIMQRIKHLKSYLQGERKIKMLEIGCGTGMFLKHCRDVENYEVEGVEPNKKMCEVLRENNINVVNGKFEDISIRDKRYDVVCMFHVLEHVWDAVHSIKRINAILDAGGMLYLELPNYDTPARKLFGKYWFNYHAPRHLTHFDRESMHVVARECGFEVINIKGEIRPTINTISMQYYCGERCSSNIFKKIFSANNPLMVALGIFAELIFAAKGKLSTMTVVLRKERDLKEPIESKIVEKGLP